MPNQGVPVIFKNKIAYGYAEKSVQAYDVSVSDYNALTEQQQLDGSIRFIQGVDAIPNGSNVWAKLGTTPLAEGLPRDCSQAVNQLKSNLTELENRDFELVAYKSGLSTSLQAITYSSELNYTDYKMLIFSLAWQVGANTYRASGAFMPSTLPLDAYYVIQLGSGFQAYVKFTGNKAGTMHYIAPPSGLSVASGYVYGIK